MATGKDLNSLQEPAKKVATWFELGLIGVSLAVINWLHFRLVGVSHDYSNGATHSYHAIIQFLYYLPVIHSAIRFGIKGGIMSALAASTVYAVHILGPIGLDDLIEHLLQIILINLIGWVTGALSYSEKKITGQYIQLVSRQKDLIDELEASNKAVAQANLELEKEMAERKVLEEWLRRSERLSAMGHLAAGVAHEMRNPLGIIRATMQILEDEQKASEAVRECSGVIKEECDRMNSVIEEFLKFARPAEPKFAQLNLAELVEDVLLFTSKYITALGIRVVQDIPEDLRHVWADPGQLKQVLVNLIINAVDAMPNGGVLQVAIAEKGDSQEISVKDSGEGIPKDILPHIFDPFFSTKSKGTGLGLSIVGRILENHHGQINVTSEEGLGTEFVLTLPVERGDK